MDSMPPIPPGIPTAPLPSEPTPYLSLLENKQALKE